MNHPPAAPRQHQILTEQLRFENTARGDTITAVLARGDLINQNRAYYSSTVLERAANDATDRLAEGKLIGLMNHPNIWIGEGNKGAPGNIVIKWSKLWMDGPDLKGEGTIVNTRHGDDLRALREAGVHVGLSTNAKAKLHYEAAKNVPARWDGDENDLIDVIDELELLTIDVVNDPANTHARILTESRQRQAEAQEQETRMNELEKAQERAAALEAKIQTLTEELTAAKTHAEEATAKAEAATTAAAKERRTSIAREAIAAAPHLTDALKTAVLLTAETAESDEAAKEAVDNLTASIPTGNGNNAVPEAKQEQKHTISNDPLRATREALRSN